MLKGYSLTRVTLCQQPELLKYYKTGESNASLNQWLIDMTTTNMSSKQQFEFQ